MGWLEEWIHDARDPWRKPDKFEGFEYHYEAVWYSAPPLGKYGSYDESFPPEQSQFATRVQLSREAFVFTEYTHISEWYMDEPWDPQEHGDFWRMQVVEFDPEDVREYFLKAAEANSEIQMPRAPEATARLFASLGSYYVHYYGGEEDEAESLP